VELKDGIQETIAATANKATTAGSATSVVSWVGGSDLGFWIGIAIGLAGLFINLYYKWKHDRRAAEAHRAYMRRHELLGTVPSEDDLDRPHTDTVSNPGRV
jgi:hypothetical protein